LRAAQRRWSTTVYERLGLAAVALVALVAADEVGGNGFIAAFVAGAAAGMTAGPLREHMIDFAEEEGERLRVAVFFIFGAFAVEALAGATWQMLGYAVLSLTVIRMLPVAIALAGVTGSAHRPSPSWLVRPARPRLRDPRARGHR
jgi:sodium/hydrogen antiporter